MEIIWLIFSRHVGTWLLCAVILSILMLIRPIKFTERKKLKKAWKQKGFYTLYFFAFSVVWLFWVIVSLNLLIFSPFFTVTFALFILGIIYFEKGIMQKVYSLFQKPLASMGAIIATIAFYFLSGNQMLYESISVGAGSGFMKDEIAVAIANPANMLFLLIFVILGFALVGIAGFFTKRLIKIAKEQYNSKFNEKELGFSDKAFEGIGIPYEIAKLMRSYRQVLVATFLGIILWDVQMAVYGIGKTLYLELLFGNLWFNIALYAVAIILLIKSSLNWSPTPG